MSKSLGSFFVVMVGGAVALAACTAAGTGSDASAGRGARADEPSASADGGARHVLPEDGLGASCTLGGSPDHVSAKDDASCAQGVCVYDGVHRLTQEKTGQSYYDAYCSADCSAADCPVGWDCMVADGRRSVCVKQPAVCGDGVKQYGEACDDGNGSALDGCNADCSAVLPSSLNVISLDLGTIKAKRWFPTLPYDDQTNLAVLDEVTPDRIVLRFAVSPNRYVYTLRIPRTVGVVDPASPDTSGIAWFAAQKDGAPLDVLQNKRTEVVSVGADRRSYRVRFEAKDPTTLRGELIVTVP